MHITQHAVERVRERVKLPKRAVSRRAETAIKRGRHHTKFRGIFRKYLDDKQRRHGGSLYVHGSYIYVVNNENLITVLLVPKTFLKAID